MIPKIIHYCWFGGNPLPEDTARFIEGWRTLNPDFQIIQWDETNFPINYCIYSAEAYAMKNWAFVSDVCRLYALKNYGGIYLDTDIEEIKPFISLLAGGSFLGDEGTGPAMGVVGAPAGAVWVAQFLKFYQKRHFVNVFGHPVRTPNPTLYQRFIEPNLSAAERPRVYPKDYFYPQILPDGKAALKPESVTVHHYAASWRRRRTLWSRIETILKGLRVRYLSKISF